MTRDEVQAIELDLASSAIGIKLRGLQSLARQIEAGRFPIDQGNLPMLIQACFWSPLAKERRWSYYCAEKLKLSACVDTLDYRARSEEDDESRMWAWSAFIKLADPKRIRKVIRDPTFSYAGTSIELIPLPNSVKSEHRQMSLFDRDIGSDPLRARWSAIAHGYSNPIFDDGETIKVDRNLILGLQQHEDESVAEYAIWAFFNRPEGTADDLIIPAEKLSLKAPGIRGWAYRLLTKRGVNAASAEIMIAAILDELSKNEYEARKGLAEALQNRYWKGLENFILPWKSEEKNNQIADVLLTHIARNCDRCAKYREYLLDNLTIFAQHEASARVLKTVFYRDVRRYNKFLSEMRKFDQRKVEIIMGNKIQMGDVSITGGTVAFGDMKIGVVNQLHELDHNHPLAPAASEIERLFTLIEANKAIPADAKSEVAKAITEVAQAKPEDRPGIAKRTLAVLRGLADGTKSIANIGDNTADISEHIERISPFFESMIG